VSPIVATTVPSPGFGQVVDAGRQPKVDPLFAEVGLDHRRHLGAERVRIT
jgi:hypothetical protein